MPRTSKAAVVLQPVETTSGTGLLCIRRGDPPGVGKLALPGGHVEPGETWRVAAARELHEETGVRCNPYRLHSFARQRSGATDVQFGLAPPILRLPSFRPTDEILDREIVMRPIVGAFPSQTSVMGGYFGGNNVMSESKRMRSWADDMIAEIRHRMRSQQTRDKVILQTLKQNWDTDDLIAVLDAIMRAQMSLGSKPLTRLYEIMQSSNPWVSTAATLALLASGGEELVHFALEYPEDVPHHDIVFHILAAFKGTPASRKKQRGVRRKR